MIDICREFTSKELKYIASVAEGYERWNYRNEIEKRLEREFEGKDIPVLKYLMRGAQEIATCFANVRYHYDVMYGHDGIFYILRENALNKEKYLVTIKLNYGTDEVDIYPSGPNIVANVNDIKRCVNKFGESSYKWIETRITPTELHYKIEWTDRESAFSRIAEDEEYIADLGDRLFRGNCFGL